MTDNARDELAALISEWDADGSLMALPDAILARFMVLRVDGWRGHHVVIDDRRIECLDSCPGPAPHVYEYRAHDINPNR